MEKEKKLVSSSKQPKIVYLLLIIGVISMIVAGVMGTRLFKKFGHLPPPSPRQTNVSLIEGWMTIPYVSRTYHIPEPMLLEKLNIDPGTSRKKSLQDLAKMQGQSQTAFLEKIRQIISDLQSQDPSFGNP
jgi:NADH:ubiquinone oxidoreductase subunit B-like Fe-S oxidoreductase